MNISAQYLDGSYHEKNPTFHVEDSPWKAAQIVKMLRRHGISPASVCEVGCGAGEILVQLATHYPEADFTGYELSPQAYALCRTRETERIRFFQSDLLSSETAPFDLLLCIDVFEHIEDYLTFLRRLRTRAKQIIFHVPLDMNVQMVLRSSPIIGVRRSVGHLHYFSKDTALATLADCGYQVLDWFYTPNGADRPKSTKARVLQYPRRILYRLFPEATARVLGGYSLLVLAQANA